MMTGDIPFNQYNTLVVIHKVVAGIRPERPMDAVAIGLSHSLWQIAEASWKQKPKERCTIRVVLDQLNEITRCRAPPGPSPVAADLEEEKEEKDSDRPNPFRVFGASKHDSLKFTWLLLILISRGGSSEGGQRQTQ